MMNISNDDDDDDDDDDDGDGDDDMYFMSYVSQMKVVYDGHNDDGW
jgi:hypothetical protein